MPSSKLTVTVERSVVVLRSNKVILDADLAALYGVTTKRLNEAVKRNSERFPAEYASLRSQIATSNRGRGGRRYAPWAFTEHGAIMAATVLNSRRAIEMSIYVVRVFVRLRELAGAHHLLAATLAELEKRVTKHDSELAEIINILRALLQPTPRARRKIGFISQT
jgi:hypothetical protein